MTRRSIQGEARDAPSTGLRLCVMSGAHRGASATLGRDALVVIGQRDDCDVILSDNAVAPHHCIVSTVGGALMVRAVDGSVTVDGRTVAPGGPSPLEEFDALCLTDDVNVLVGRPDDPRWDELLRSVAVRRVDEPVPPPRRWPVATAAMFALAASATAAALMLRDDSLARLPARVDDVRGIVGAMKMPEIIVAGRDGDIRVAGVADDPAQRDALHDALTDVGQGLDFAVRTGADIATDVREVLRMSGLGAQTRYLGAGEVAVTGSFADEDALQEALKSRAVLDVVGLHKVTVKNDRPFSVKPERGLIPPEKKIVAVVRGMDPYVVTGDGSRYYIGALLPSGGRLHDITEDAVWVMEDGEVIRLSPKLTHVVRSQGMQLIGQQAQRSKQ